MGATSSGKVEYIGHIVKFGYLEIYKTNVVSLGNVQPQKKLRLFLVFFNVYRRFIADFTLLSHPLK